MNIRDVLTHDIWLRGSRLLLGELAGAIILLAALATAGAVSDAGWFVRAQAVLAAGALVNYVALFALTARQGARPRSHRSPHVGLRGRAMFAVMTLIPLAIPALALAQRST